MELGYELYFGGVVQILRFRCEVFNFVADYGLCAEDDAVLRVMEGGLNQLAEVELGAVEGVGVRYGMEG